MKKLVALLLALCMLTLALPVLAETATETAAKGETQTETATEATAEGTKEDATKLLELLNGLLNSSTEADSTKTDENDPMWQEHLALQAAIEAYVLNEYKDALAAGAVQDVYPIGLEEISAEGTGKFIGYIGLTNYSVDGTSLIQDNYASAVELLALTKNEDGTWTVVEAEQASDGEEYLTSLTAMAAKYGVPMDNLNTVLDANALEWNKAEHLYEFLLAHPEYTTIEYQGEQKTAEEIMEIVSAMSIAQSGDVATGEEEGLGALLGSLLSGSGETEGDSEGLKSLLGGLLGGSDETEGESAGLGSLLGGLLSGSGETEGDSAGLGSLLGGLMSGSGEEGGFDASALQGLLGGLMSGSGEEGEGAGLSSLLGKLSGLLGGSEGGLSALLGKLGGLLGGSEGEGGLSALLGKLGGLVRGSGEEGSKLDLSSLLGGLLGGSTGDSATFDLEAYLDSPEYKDILAIDATVKAYIVDEYKDGLEAGDVQYPCLVTGVDETTLEEGKAKFLYYLSLTNYTADGTNLKMKNYAGNVELLYVTKNADGTWTVTEAKQAKDGEEYDASIAEMAKEYGVGLDELNKALDRDMIEWSEIFGMYDVLQQHPEYKTVELQGEPKTSDELIDILANMEVGSGK